VVARIMIGLTGCPVQELRGRVMIKVRAASTPLDKVCRCKVRFSILCGDPLTVIAWVAFTP
jgi:hypothetical protein